MLPDASHDREADCPTSVVLLSQSHKLCLIMEHRMRNILQNTTCSLSKYPGQVKGEKKKKQGKTEEHFQIGGDTYMQYLILV